MCLNFNANGYNLIVYYFLQISPPTIITMQYIERRFSTEKLIYKIIKLHHKFIDKKTYLHCSNRFYSRDAKLLMYYLDMIIDIIKINYNLYIEEIINYYDKIYDRVIDNLICESLYLHIGEQIKYNNNVISYFINNSLQSYNAELCHSCYGDYIFIIHLHEFTQLNI
jgi:hypothetical protein